MIRLQEYSSSFVKRKAHPKDKLELHACLLFPHSHRIRHPVIFPSLDLELTALTIL